MTEFTQADFPNLDPVNAAVVVAAFKYNQARIVGGAIVYETIEKPKAAQIGWIATGGRAGLNSIGERRIDTPDDNPDGRGDYHW